jgi:hypothetical protein
MTSAYPAPSSLYRNWGSVSIMERENTEESTGSQQLQLLCNAVASLKGTRKPHTSSFILSETPYSLIDLLCLPG